MAFCSDFTCSLWTPALRFLPGVQHSLHLCLEAMIRVQLVRYHGRISKKKVTQAIGTRMGLASAAPGTAPSSAPSRRKRRRQTFEGGGAEATRDRDQRDPRSTYALTSVRWGKRLHVPAALLRHPHPVVQWTPCRAARARRVRSHFPRAVGSCSAFFLESPRDEAVRLPGGGRRWPGLTRHQLVWHAPCTCRVGART